MKRARVRRLAAISVVLAFVLSACQADWAQWGHGIEKQGWSPSEFQIGPNNAAQLHERWSRDLGAILDASPVVATGITVNGQARDVLYLGTEHGLFYAVDTAGNVLWQRDLGHYARPDCPDSPDAIFGISAAGLYDRNRNAVYVNGGDGNIYALDPATGANKPGWPIQFSPYPATEVIFSAPTLVGNHLYFETSSRCDVAPYKGRVIDINPDQPAIVHTWYATNPNGPDGGGIWGWGGASVDPTNGDVFVATGNVVANPPENGYYGESLVQLSSDLQLKAFHKPGVSIRDDDFGATPVLFQKDGCPPQLAVEQKNGALYLYDRATIANGYRQKVVVIDPPDPTITPHEPGLIGEPIWYPKTQMLYVVTPRAKADGTFGHGLIAFTLDQNCMLQVAWQQTTLNTSIAVPMSLANDVVYVSGGYTGRQTYAVDARNGNLLWTSPRLTGAVYPAPTIVNGQVFTVGYDQKLRAYGL